MFQLRRVAEGIGRTGLRPVQPQASGAKAPLAGARGSVSTLIPGAPIPRRDRQGALLRTIFHIANKATLPDGRVSVTLIRLSDHNPLLHPLARHDAFSWTIELVDQRHTSNRRLERFDPGIAYHVVLQ